MSKDKMIVIGVTALVTLAIAGRLRKLPLVNKIPEV